MPDTPTPPATKNRNLHAARSAKNDEFYTQLSDIENELRHYKPHFRGKTVYLNCDDPRESNFFRYFAHNFQHLGLRRLIATSFKGGVLGDAVYYDYAGLPSGASDLDLAAIEVKPLDGDGDFRSPESLALLTQADIVVTNPPFSLFRDFVAQLVEHDKKFVIVGNKNAITYKEIFPLIQSGKLWVGAQPMGTDMLFDVPPHRAEQLLEAGGPGSKYRVVDGVVKARAQACWFTNMDYPQRHEDLVLFRNYTPAAYPTYDNYNAINIDKVADIPADYNGAMGVPITFLDKWNPAQFEIVSCDDLRATGDVPLKPHGLVKDKEAAIGGKPTYVRILIRKKARP